MRLRTCKTKGCGSRVACRTMVFKLRALPKAEGNSTAARCFPRKVRGLIARSLEERAVSSTLYDAKGRVTSTTDTLGNTTSSIYDARDELIQTIYPVDPNVIASHSSWELVEVRASKTLKPPVQPAQPGYGMTA